MKIVLATKSPYRREAFKMLDIEFTTEGSDVDEYFEGRPENPEELVKHLARLKAEAVAKNYSKEIVIGFDSIGWFEGLVLEKPKSRDDAFERLKMLSGKVHHFYTGIYMINLETGQILSRSVETELVTRELSDEEINKYLDQDPNYNTYALGYDPLGSYSSTFVEKCTGSYNSFTRGIPLELIVKMLKEIGYKLG
ncbi:Maf family protein [Candidatus Falkowbacteria bacterium]|nr:Maf family protein [Candidatus Falkowbacteria bacterium]